MPVRRGLATDRGADGSAGFSGDAPMPGDVPPPAAPAIPTTMFGGDVSNQDNPRDLAAQQAPDVHRPTSPGAPPSTQASGGGPAGTPPQSTAPSPIAAGPPQPFTPIMPPGGPGPSAGGLYGSMGGLTGGGLGVPNVLGDHGGAPQSSVDIQRLLQLLGVGGGGA